MITGVRSCEKSSLLSLISSKLISSKIESEGVYARGFVTISSESTKTGISAENSLSASPNDKRRSPAKRVGNVRK